MRTAEEVKEQVEDAYRHSMKLYCQKNSPELAHTVGVLGQCLGKSYKDIQFDEHMIAAMMYH